jgi:hypothetical protein
MIPKYYGKGRTQKRSNSGMNQLETRYLAHLEMLRAAHEILWIGYEAAKLKLAANTFYTPDFMVMTKDLQIEFHEVKGFWEDDARVKIKCAAEKFPFRFLAIKRSKAGWDVEEF